MTLTTLATILACLCGNKATFADKQECADPYLNCAVMENGHVMTKPDFIKKCMTKDDVPSLAKRCPILR